MELWIRSQDKQKLVKVDNLYISIGNYICYYVEKGKELEGTHFRPTGTLGKYDTYERALEILDEIQKEMTQTFLLKNEHTNCVNMDDLRNYYRRKEINFVEVPKGIELEPINKDILVYEMPDE